MAKHTYTVNHGGAIFTRTTERTYTHVVISERLSGNVEAFWCGSRKLAEKKQRSEGGEIVSILPEPNFGIIEHWAEYSVHRQEC